MANITEAMSPLLDGIEKVADILAKRAFIANENPELKIALARVKNFFGFNSEEAAIFCLIFTCYYGYNETPVHIGILSTEERVSALRFLEFRDTFRALEEKGFKHEIVIDDPGLETPQDVEYIASFKMK